MPSSDLNHFDFLLFNALKNFKPPQRSTMQTNTKQVEEDHAETNEREEENEIVSRDLDVSPMEDISLDDTLLVFGYCRALSGVTAFPRDISRICAVLAFSPDEPELFIGNLHSKNEGVRRNKHKWEMFISTSKERLIPPRTIEKVEYTLHETFKNPVRERTESPFYLKTNGYGEFMVKARIQFKPRYKRADVHCAHGLSFKGFACIHAIDPETPSGENACARKRGILFKEPRHYPLPRGHRF